MSQALYRKYRSRSLDEIVGQEHITSLLRRAIDAGSISHAYLLTGPRGVGKTSIARIIAHEINGLTYDEEASHLDIIEIDAASNNGVEDVRDLRDKVHVAPSSAPKKVYIIDEVHMLSKAAFNALLKTLEEPPAHVVFILATTDVEKLPETIISRVQQFHFRSIPEETAVSHLRHIAKNENISIDDDALALIARHGGGSFRDSISLLDQLRHSAGDGNTVTVDTVRSVLGATSDTMIDELIAAHRSHDLARLVAAIRELESTGAYAGVVTKQLISKLQTGILEHPEDIPVLESLLEVSASTHPYIKLMTVLAPRQNHTQHTASSAPSTPPAKPQAPKTPAKSPPKEKPQKPAEQPVDSTPPAPAAKADATEPIPIADSLSWEQLLDAAGEDIALKSLLNRCKHIQEGTTVTVYAGSRFNAERLTSPKQQPKLHAVLEKIGASHFTFDIRAEKPPLSDSQTAAVAAIMGGGEEVAYSG